MKTFRLLAFLHVALAIPIYAQSLDLNAVMSGESFACRKSNLCCEKGIELGEERLHIVFMSVNLIGSKLFISGEITNEYDAISVVLGYGFEDEICPVETLAILSGGDKVFSVEFDVVDSSIVYFTSLSFQASVYYVGRLLE